MRTSRLYPGPVLIPFLIGFLPAVSLDADDAGPAGDPLVLIVHSMNTVKDLSRDDVRAFLSLQKQFWPSGKRVVLFLRPSNSATQKTLLEIVYKMTTEELRKYWVGKAFAGEIPAIPTVMRTAAAASAVVAKFEGAISIVHASEVPEGVTVLTIDGKKPKDPGYLLAESKVELVGGRAE